MKRVKSFLAILLACVLAVCTLPATERNGAKAADNIDWVECTYDSAVKKSVYTTKDTWYGISYVGSQGVYIGYLIPKGTYIGKVIQSVSASRTKETTKYTYYPGTSTNIGSTWKNSYDIIVEMCPQNIIAKQYASKDKSFSVYYETGAKKNFYVASEDVYTYTVTPCTVSKGFMDDWAPRKKQSTDGSEALKFQFSNKGVSLGYENITVSSDSGPAISWECEDNFVDVSDLTDSESGFYKMDYDYKKYTKLRYCSSARRKVVFAHTFIHDSVRWVNRSVSYSGYVCSVATFTVCSSNSNPYEIVSSKVNVLSNRLIIE